MPYWRRLIAVLAATVLAVTGCASLTGGAKTETTLTVGVINNFPPFEYVEDGKLTGFDVELVEAIAKEEGLEVEWRQMGFDGLIPALQANQISCAVSDISVTADRKEVVDFTDSYYEDGYSVAVKEGSPVRSLDDLKGKTIVATQGTQGVTVAKKLAKEHGVRTRVLTTSNALYLAVSSGQAEALTIDTSSLSYRLKKDGDDPTVHILRKNVTTAPAAIAVPKGNEERVQALNSGLKKIRENGTYAKIYEKYFG